MKLKNGVVLLAERRVEGRNKKDYLGFSPPRGKWVPVRAEMVFVIDLAK